MQVFTLKDILYEDDDIIVCHKHAGMAVQSARSSQVDMESSLRNYLSQKNDGEKIPYIGIMGRLDQPVEGVIIFAKNPETTKNLNHQMQQNKLEKYYLARVADQENKLIEGQRGELVNFLLKEGRTNTSKVVREGTKASKRAALAYKVIVAGDNEGLLKIQLKTGRHHQIRVQLAHAGMPISGDRKYNPVADGTKQLALCAYLLKFKHPRSGEEMIFEIKSVNESLR